MCIQPVKEGTRQVWPAPCAPRLAFPGRGDAPQGALSIFRPNWQTERIRPTSRKGSLTDGMHIDRLDAPHPLRVRQVVHLKFQDASFSLHHDGGLSGLPALAWPHENAVRPRLQRHRLTRFQLPKVLSIQIDMRLGRLHGKREGYLPRAVCPIGPRRRGQQFCRVPGRIFKPT